MATFNEVIMIFFCIEPMKNDTLAPFIGEDVIEFWCLDERALENFEDEVIKQ